MVALVLRAVNRMLHGWLLLQEADPSAARAASDLYDKSAFALLCHFYLSRVNSSAPTVMRTRHRLVPAIDVNNLVSGVHLQGANIDVLPSDLQQVRLTLREEVVASFCLFEEKWQALAGA
jgi:hypothetical protein